MTFEPEIEHVREKNLATQLLVVSSAEASRVMDTFSNWMIGGFGAAAALMVTNLESVQPMLSAEALGRAFTFFVGAVVATVFQKYLASSVRAGAAAYGAGWRIGEEAGDGDLSQEVFLRELESAYFYPGRWIVRWAYRRAMENDLAVGGRILSKATQIQGLLIALQVALLLGGANVLVRKIVG